jgi:hypothetical protein
LPIVAGTTEHSVKRLFFTASATNDVGAFGNPTFEANHWSIVIQNAAQADQVVRRKLQQGVTRRILLHPAVAQLVHQVDLASILPRLDARRPWWAPERRRKVVTVRHGRLGRRQTFHRCWVSSLPFFNGMKPMNGLRFDRQPGRAGAERAKRLVAGNGNQLVATRGERESINIRLSRMAQCLQQRQPQITSASASASASANLEPRVVAK